MSEKKMKAIDGNTAATHVAYSLTDVATIYPITPSSPMGEMADSWSANGRKNIFGNTLDVSELQSEKGAAGAVHGSLSAGALTTTFTASQGLLLMVPNIYKMAGEQLPGVFHVAARSVATHALSIFGDHSDVMAVRQTGAGMISSNSVQEAMDLGLVTHLAAIETSLPFVHFFDGFRTSHEISKVEMIDYEDIKKIVNYDAIKKFKKRAMRPEDPTWKGTAQNPDIFFQAREASNVFYTDAPEKVQEAMDKVYEITGRRYNLFDYVGAEDAKRVIIAMGSGCEAAHETVDYLTDKGEKVGLIKVRLYRPFSKKHLIEALPETVKAISVLDRTKEPGSDGEPLFKDVSTAMYEVDEDITVVGGRYGLSSKEFTPSMIKAVFDNLKKDNPKNHFTIGIKDDVTNTSLEVKDVIDTTPEGTVQCKFWGFGSDGTVGANKNAIKIIGNNTDMYAQGYFSYSSKKSGGITLSNLRFGKKPIKSTYLINKADYVACHKPEYIYKYDLVDDLKDGGTFVLNTTWSKEKVLKDLPDNLKKEIAERDAKFYIINAIDIADEVGLGQRINMVMQTVFFKLSGVLDFDKAIDLLKDAIRKTYGHKGEKIVKMNHEAVDMAQDALVEIDYPDSWKNADQKTEELKTVKEPYYDEKQKEFVEDTMSTILRQKGDELPVSKFNADGSFPVGTSRFEKRGVAIKMPKWISDKCVQCNACSFVCPHAAIRPYLLTDEEAENAPDSFETVTPNNKQIADYNYRMQLYPMDCVGCGNCADICPTNALEMVFSEEIQEEEIDNNQYAIDNVPVRDDVMPKDNVIGSQFSKPLFEFSGACAGCGETPYYKLATQLFGDRMIIANATGCSSIYGGSAPVCPFPRNKEGEGPTWANSLFEDNAEYGYGMALAVKNKRNRIKQLFEELMEANEISSKTADLMKEWIKNMKDAEKTKELAKKLESAFENEDKDNPKIEELIELKDYLVKKSVWIMGGDGWAYDIGYGGLDHVLASKEDVNVMVLDTEVYSNTGGQASKASQLGQVAKFAASGKKVKKKDLGLMAMTYGYVYVASVSMGANRNQLLKAMIEAEQYDGPSIIIAYSPCINHGLDMSHAQKEEKLAVETGFWPLYRYNPELKEKGENPFKLEYKGPQKDIKELINNEVRFKTLEKSFPGEAEKLQKLLKEDIKERYEKYKNIAENGF